MKPFMKWAGGKSWLIQQYPELFDIQYNNYIEPFLGGGAVFFGIQPSSGIISDSNEELINVYTIMRDHPQELSDQLIKHNAQHNKEYYYFIRSARYTDPLDRAARTMYLNRTCFNGLYRVNKKGEYNVPIGTRNSCLNGIELFDEYSERLKNIQIICCDFTSTIEKASCDDFLFVDPPYLSIQNRLMFGKYNSNLFSWDDQERLYDSFLRASEKGVKIIMTNVYDDSIRELYSDFSVRTIERRSSIAGNASKRKMINELLITSNI